MQPWDINTGKRKTQVLMLPIYQLVIAGLWERGITEMVAQASFTNKSQKLYRAKLFIFLSLPLTAYMLTHFIVRGYSYLTLSGSWEIHITYSPGTNLIVLTSTSSKRTVES